MFKESASYRNVPREEPEGFASAIKRISWGAIFAGGLVALVVQLLLSLLGLGIGMSTIDPIQEQNPFSGLGMGAIIWWVGSILISLFIGGWVAGRLAGMPRNTDSILHGILTWSLYTLVSFYLLTTAVGRVVSGVGSVVGDALGLAGKGVSAVAPEIKDQISQELKDRGIGVEDIKQEAMLLLRQTGKAELQPENIGDEASKAKKDIKQNANEVASNPQAAEGELSGVIDRLFGQGKDIVNEVDREAAINVVMKRTGKSRQEAAATVDGWIQTYQQGKAQISQTASKAKEQARQTGDQVASAVSKASIYAFLALVLGAGMAGLGGFVGKPKDIISPVPTPASVPVYKNQ